MAFQWLRRALMALACATLLAACGGGNIVDPFQPTRMVVFGDGFAALGTGNDRYTINDGSTNIWTLQLASRYGLAASAVVSAATGNARVTATTGATGAGATPTVATQVSNFLTTGGGPLSGDMIVINAGTADIVAEAANSSTARTNIMQAGTAMGTLVQDLVRAGAKRVVVVGPYNLGVSPWATATGQTSTLQGYSIDFNNALLIAISSLDNRQVQFVNLAQYFQQAAVSPSSFGLSNSIDLACSADATATPTAVDPGLGIGTGANQVNSSLCSPSTLAVSNGSTINPALYLFADRIYPTPVAHRLFGDFAYTTLRARW